MAKEVRVITEQAQKVARDARAIQEKMPVSRAEITDVKALMKSLTPAQRELQKSRGYLKSTDLTPAQLKMLPVSGTGDWSFTFTVDGEKL
jgi:Na+-transporting NADH:ubiquinone oxidoreductase subunit NqrC